MNTHSPMTEEVKQEEVKEELDMEIKENSNDAISVPIELLPPQKTLEDIWCDPEEVDEKDIKEQLKKGEQTKKTLQKGKVDLFASRPSMILSDWLFLGNARDAFQLSLLESLGITHILNITREVCTYHILNKKYPIKYAQLSVDDHTNVKIGENIYNYFEATKAFIDECNPALNNNNGNKILVHCAAGKSRSSTIIIAYLMASVVNMNEMELKRLQHIRSCLSDDKFIHKMKEGIQFMMTPTFKIFSDIEAELNEIQKQKLDGIRRECHDDRCLKLNEAYYFVKSCRVIISPNIGFCATLKRYEQLYQNGEDTLCDLPAYSDWDNDTIIIWRGAKEQYPIEYPLVEVNRQNCCCIVL